MANSTSKDKEILLGISTSSIHESRSESRVRARVSSESESDRGMLICRVPAFPWSALQYSLRLRKCFSRTVVTEVARVAVEEFDPDLGV